MTGVDAPPPPKKSGKNAAGRGRLAAAAPAPVQPARNLVKPVDEGWKDLSFKVTDSFRREYKTAASTNGISMVSILKESFELWCEKNGVDRS